MPIDRPSGFLADLGAPDVFYLNMAFDVTPDADHAAAAISAAQGARAMVVDMRGYPEGDHYQAAASLMPDGYWAPDFGGVVASAPGQYQLVEFGTFFVETDLYYPGIPTYTGPIILLVGTDTVSAGENFSMLLSNNGRPMHIVGRGTGGTNGPLTGIEVLGHYSFSFTAADVHNADGSRFIGLGIPVDVPVTLTQAGVANGNDPELNTAVALIGP
jgi:C-terminal processing protease CtpA/Prc